MIVLGKFGDRVHSDYKYTVFNGNEFISVYGRDLMKNIGYYDNLKPALINVHAKEVQSAIIQSVGSDIMMVQNGSIIVIKDNDIILLWINGFVFQCDNAKGELSGVHVSDYRVSLYIGSKIAGLTSDGRLKIKGVCCMYYDKVSFGSALRLAL